VVYLVTWT